MTNSESKHNPFELWALLWAQMIRSLRGKRELDMRYMHYRLAF